MKLKKRFFIMIAGGLVLAVTLFTGCGSDEKTIADNEKELNNPQDVSVMATDVPETPDEQKGFLSKTKAELSSIVYEDLELNQSEWCVEFLKQTEDEVYGIVYPMGTQTEITGCCATIKEKRQDFLYAVWLRYEGTEIIKNSVTEYGVSQLGFFETENGLLLGVVYRDVVAGWEEYGMACYLVNEFGSLTRMEGTYEKSTGLYNYWKDRKPVLKEDGSFEIFIRKQEKDSFECLVLNEDLKCFESYTDYVPEYIWELEKRITANEWVEKKSVVSPCGSNISGPELIRKLRIAENNNSLPEEIYFNVGGQSAVVADYIRVTHEKLFYFVIKKYGDSHQAGFQSLYIGVIDKDGKFLQCKSIQGDKAQALLDEMVGGVQVVYRTETEYTGMKTEQSGIIYLTPDTWEERGTLPKEEAEDFIPIDEAYFVSTLFCDYIKEQFDKDADGRLSVFERYAVSKIEIPPYYEEDFSMECLDGFDYFPSLTELSVNQNSLEKVVLRNHPSIKFFGGTEGSIKNLEIMDCPELTNIGFYTYGLGSLWISGVSPEASFSHGDNVNIDKMTVDADLILWVTDSRSGEPALKASGDGLVYEYYEYKEDNEYTIMQTPVEFINRKELQVPFSESEWIETLQQGTYEIFEIRDLKKAEDVYNEDGISAWYVSVNYTKSKNSREVYSGKEVFTMYSDEMPKIQQFVFRPNRIKKIRGLEYAPNREARMLVEWDLDLVYQTEDEEKIIGVFADQEHYCTIDAQGTTDVIPSHERWNE